MSDEKDLGAQSATEGVAAGSIVSDAAPHAAPRHTPGLWTVAGRDGEVIAPCHEHHDCHKTIVFGSGLYPPGDYLKCSTGPHTIANAHLIAAAPELLAACQALMETHHGWHLGAGPCICHAHEAARKAILKAEGKVTA